MRILNVGQISSRTALCLAMLALALAVAAPSVEGQKKSSGSSSSSRPPAVHSAPAAPRPSAPPRTVQHNGGNQTQTRSVNRTNGTNRSAGVTSGYNRTNSAGSRTNNSVGSRTNNTVGSRTNNTLGRTNNTSGVKPSPFGTKTTSRSPVYSSRSVRTITAAPGGGKKIITRSGSEVRYARNGRVAEIHARGVSIYHGRVGGRRIIVDRPDHSRVVVYGRRFGYIQRPFVWRGREFVSRTYYFSGRPYAFYYRGYPYRGLYLNGYVPYRYYRPAFYGWAYNPWGYPIHYAWGWAGDPWAGYYGYYFRPYPTYPGASFWLTDFLLSSSLQQAYLAGAESQAADASASSLDSGSQVLSDDVKQAIADEVRNQIALENSESQTALTGALDINSSGIPRILAEANPDHPRTFLVGSAIDVTDASGNQCELSGGDVLRLSLPPDADATAANLTVLASKSQECPGGSTVQVSLADLQEMQNQMRAGIDQGLEQLQAHQGGIPAPPASAAAPPVKSAFAPIAPPPDPNVSGELQQQSQQADSAEQGALTEANQTGNSGGTGSTPQIDIGQTIEQVTAALGNPVTSARAGSKLIYVYQGLKVTFVDGKVTDIQ